MAIFPFVRQFSQVDLAWFEAQNYPRLKIWLESFISSPLFEQIMEDYSPWVAGDEPTYVVF
jgi:glutathione S-transferase